MKGLIAQFIPIVLIVLFLTQSEACLTFSHTIFGKLIAACILVFYASIDKILGLFVCALLIFYYQSDYVDYYMPKEVAPLVNIVENDVDKFRKENCSNNTFMHKGVKVVRHEMIEHIFPTLSYVGNPCNPCDVSCPVRIKLDTEDKLRETFVSEK